MFFINICYFGGMYAATLDIFKVHIKQPRQTSLYICLSNLVKTDYSRQSYDVISFSRRLPRHRDSTSGFGFVILLSEKVEIYLIPNFGEISQSTGEILLLPVSKNLRPSCWNFSRGSHFYVCITIGMSFCICLPNFVHIGPSATEL